MTQSPARFRLIRVTPTVDTSAYADADQLGSLMTFSAALPDKRQGIVKSACLIFKSGTPASVNMHLFRESPTISSTDNAALNISDSEMATKYVGSFNFSAGANTNTEALSANAVMYQTNINLIVDSIDGNLYAILQATAAITFTATSDLVVVLGIEQV